MSSAVTGAGNVTAALRASAMDLARAWADAQHQQQLYLYFAMVKHKKDNQNLLQQGLSVLGLDSIDTGSEPGPPAVPGPRLRRHHRAPGPGAGRGPPAARRHHLGRRATPQPGPAPGFSRGG